MNPKSPINNYLKPPYFPSSYIKTVPILRTISKERSGICFSPNNINDYLEKSKKGSPKDSAFSETINLKNNKSSPTRDLIINTESKMQELLHKNIELNKIISEKNKELENERQINVKYQSKINENEKLLQLYQEEKAKSEECLKEKETEIDKLINTIKKFEQETLDQKILELKLNKCEQIISKYQSELDNLKKNPVIQNSENKIPENQMKMLKKIDINNKKQIEKLFEELNLRKNENEKLQKELNESRPILKEQEQIIKKFQINISESEKETKIIKEKYLNSIQKIKNLENFFLKNFENT